jgi:hypothetical protein
MHLGFGHGFIDVPCIRTHSTVYVEFSILGLNSSKTENTLLIKKKDLNIVLSWYSRKGSGKTSAG